ncbi:MAG: hypothetical protein ACJ790_12565 [Myxococcaceae bacterium]
MRASKSQKRSRKQRTYAFAKLGRPGRLSVDSHALVRVWRRVLQRRLKSRMRGRVLVEIHDNTHTMVTFSKERGLWRLRLHHMFLGAPDEALSQLASFVRTGDAQASAALDRYIERNKALIRRLPPALLRKRLKIEPRGHTHDLARIFEQLNQRYFRNRVAATITYGPAPKTRLPRKSIKMGSYSSDSKVIRIHPALDQPNVPRYFVEWIVFHEMLHHVHRVRRGEDGRRCVHTPEFLEAERKFHDFARAQRWEDQNLEVLLRARVD